MENQLKCANYRANPVYFQHQEPSMNDIDDKYYEDPQYEKLQRRLERERVEYQKKRKKEIKKMEKDTIHWEEIGRLNRVMGSLNGIMKMLKEGSPECREIVYQLKGASTVLRKIALYVLKRHSEQCLDKANFKGTEEERLREMELTVKALLSLLKELNNLSALKDWEKKANLEKIEGILVDLKIT